MFVLDTNAIIYYLKGDSKSAPFIENIISQKVPVYISAITEAELFAYSNLTNKEIKQIDSLIFTLSVIPVDSRIARVAGFLKRNYFLKTPDSIIAATTIFTGSSLITRNIRDFKKIPDIKLINI